MFARTLFAVERLLALGVPMDTRDRWGTSPIEAFSRLGARGADLVAMLIARGVAAPPDVHARSAIARRSRRRPHRRRPPYVTTPCSWPPSMPPPRCRVLAAGARGVRQRARDGAVAPDRAPQRGVERRPADGDPAREAGADVAARDEEDDSTPRGWAQTSLAITRNPAGRRAALPARSFGLSGSFTPEAAARQGADGCGCVR